MLRIIKDNFSARTHEKIAEDVKRVIQKQSRAYMIVPEQQTVMSECKMAELLPDCAPKYFEVTNFTRFADSVFRSLGGLAGEYCDRGKKMLIMWRTITELSATLSMTGGKREVGAGMVERAMMAVAEVESLGIGAEELLEASKNDALKLDRRLSDKLSDLSMIYSLYKKLISEKFADSGEMLNVMAKKLEENPNHLLGYEIFIEGFTSFTEPQYRLISLLVERCSVTVHLTVSKSAEDFFEFKEIRSTEDRLKSDAKKSHADIKILSQNTTQKASDAIRQISDLLWCKSVHFDNITLQNPEEIKIYEAREPYEECDFLCADIKRKIMRGASLCDFAVIARQSESYAGILDAALKKANLPAFTAYRKDASSFELIKLIYTAYSIIRGGFAREDVLTYAKCGLSGISQDDCDEFEMYITTWQITGSRFTDGLIWNMNPDGYTARRREGTDELLIRINGTRDALIHPLLTLKSSAEAAKTVREHAGVLLDFLIGLDTENTLLRRADALELLGEVEFADDNRRLWKLICDSLDTVVEVLSDMPCDTDGFLCQLKILFSSLDIGKIPQYSDEITVGSADILRLFEKKHIYLIGVNEGEFPAIVSDDSYFSEKDKEILAQLGLSIKPDLEIKNAKELYIFTRAFSYASESVTLLYTTANTRFKATKRSGVIDRIIELSGDKLRPEKISALSAPERIFTAEYALRGTPYAEKSERRAINAALKSAGYSEALKVSEGKIKNGNLSLGEDICREFSERNLSLTQSRIDSFVNCPLAYFCRYTISLSEEKRAEFDAPGIGSFIHAILENFFTSLEAEGKKCSDLCEDEIKSLTKKSARKYIASLGEDIDNTPERTKIKLERLSRAAYPILLGLCHEFADSKFEPRFFELSMGADTNNSPNPIRIKEDGARDINVYGIIDRVDTYRSGEDVYVRVVDYKTGQKDFSPEDLGEGENLQMFLYLKSIVEAKKLGFREAIGVGDGGRLLPAGVIYLKTSLGDVRIDRPSDKDAVEAIEEMMEREGMVLDNEEVLAAMGLRYTPVYSSRYPNKIPDGKRKYLFDEEGFDKIMQTVEDSVKSLARRIRGGDASAKAELKSKKDSKCDYCKFKPICRQALTNK